MKPIQKLVEEQPTEDFQSILFSFAEENLISLMSLHKKELGLAKFCGNNDYIPTSIRFKCPLTYPEGLKNDQETIDKETGWKEDILTCSRALAQRIKRQGERNLRYLKSEHKKATLCKMLDIGTIVASRE